MSLSKVPQQICYQTWIRGTALIHPNMSESLSKSDEKPAMVLVTSDDENTSHGKEELGSSEEIVDPVVERRILRKIDLNLLTLFGVIGMMSSLGR
jgi:hypothetical protein